MGKKSVSLVRAGATGPRTPAGKARSKFNALKHGILSSAAVLTSESSEEYDRLASELVEFWQPVGRPEELCVEIMATSQWRRRRLLRAESAIISSTRLREEKTFADRVQNARLAESLFGSLGSLQKGILSHDGDGLFAAVRLLKQLRERVQSGGLDWDRDRKDLEELYGKALVEEAESAGSEANGDARSGGIPTLYRALYCDNEKQGRKQTSELLEILVDDLDGQIDFFGANALREVERAEQFNQFRADRALLPGEKECDLIIRYEAHLDRVHDRALARLERLQRMRCGQPVLPPIKVDVTQ